MSNPFIEKAKAKRTAIPRTFVNIYDKPKKKGIPPRVVEVFEITDPAPHNEANKAFDKASESYEHLIGVVVYTKEELEQWTTSTSNSPKLKSPSKSQTKATKESGSTKQQWKSTNESTMP